MTTTLRAAILLLLLTVFAVPVFADTVTAKANANSTKAWTFTPEDAVAVDLSVFWTVKTSNLFMLLICGEGENALTFGIAAGDSDRFLNIEAGLLSGLPCVVGVASFDNASKFWLNLRGAVEGPLAKSDAKPLRLKELDAAPPELEEAMSRVRALR